MIKQVRMHKVFVVHESSLIRSKLLSLLDDMAAVEFAGEAGNALAAIQNMSIVRPDLVLLDIGDRGKSGFEILDYVCRHLPACKIITLARTSPTAPGIPLPNLESGPAPDSGQYKRRMDWAIDPTSQSRIRASIQRALAADMAAAGVAQPATASDGEIRQVLDHVEYLSASADDTLSGHGNPFERRRTELGRLESATRFQVYIEQLPGVPYIAALDRNAGLLYAGSRIKSMLGLTSRQLCSDPAARSRHWHPADQDRIRAAIAQALASNSAFSIDYRVITQTGEIRWLHDQACVITSAAGDPMFMQGVMLDITERRQAQDEIEQSHHELRRMIASLDMLRQEEQKRLAQEMHDDLGQLLAAMKMDLSRLQQRLPENDPRLLQQLGGLHELVDSMVTSVRRIIADLPPKILEELGWFEALAFLASNFEKRYGIPCRLDLPDPRPTLDQRAAAPLYRMTQEALNNAVRHAHPSVIDVQVSCAGEWLEVCVCDDGCGISEEQMNKPGSFGLIGMRERAAALGGEVRITRRDGGGTEVRFRIPAVPADRQGLQA
jgi:two-component system, NarL family, sensor histidine kinase UhpB